MNIRYDNSKTASHRTTKVGGYKFHYMGSRPLKYDVKCGNTVVIPAGTTHVGIAFGQSHLTRVDEATGRIVKLNVYRVCKRGDDGKWHAKLYHA